MRQLGRGDDGRVGDVTPWWTSYFLLQAAQDGDGRLHARLVDQHLLEAALQRGVLLDVLAVFVGVVAPMQCSSPRQRGNMLPASIAPSALPAPTMVYISSMNDDLAFVFGSSFQHRLPDRSSNSPRNLAPASSARHVSTSTLFVRGLSGHFAVDDALAQALRRSPSCRRQVRRSAPGCSWCGAAAPGWRA